jgi:hypothetical protein
MLVQPPTPTPPPPPQRSPPATTPHNRTTHHHQQPPPPPLPTTTTTTTPNHPRYEKIKIVRSTLAKGEWKYDETLDDCDYLREEIAEAYVCVRVALKSILWRCVFCGRYLAGGRI